MPFTPAPIPHRSHARSHSGHEIAYRTSLDKKKTRLRITVKNELLAQVKGHPKFWRLDIDERAGTARLTGLIQNDDNPATRTGCDGGPKSASQKFSWIATSLLHLFPENTKPVPLKKVELDSQGIIFLLPEGPASRGGLKP